MSLTFPSLKLIAFTPMSLKFFLSCFKNFSKLDELDIRLLSQNFNEQIESWILLQQLFLINKNRLTLIIFGDDSTVFFYVNNDVHLYYSNIKNLTIKLNTFQDFHNLRTTLYLEFILLM